MSEIWIVLQLDLAPIHVPQRIVASLHQDLRHLVEFAVHDHSSLSLVHELSLVKKELKNLLNKPF